MRFDGLVALDSEELPSMTPKETLINKSGFVNMWVIDHRTFTAANKMGASIRV